MKKTSRTPFRIAAASLALGVGALGPVAAANAQSSEIALSPGQLKGAITANRSFVDLPVVSTAAAFVAAQLDRNTPIVVLGARLDPGCTNPAILDERIARAALLAHTNPANPIIVTGGYTQPGCKSEAQAMADGLRGLGVRNNISIEDRAGSTVGNAAYTADAINAAGGLAILVTSPFHNQRALATFRNAGVEAVAWVTK